ncbi:hypothetical protein HXX76_007598 [Chlamydomonas incerta]|uniref:2-oxoadipate dioxygenase/decarboxylase n=1 Tax=Chlamydomonas incerta TaxID=51695 RepID=A0A835SX29_CHLIN|nr:hypothetical protein HXX76_007598 [Chlamydomonas incerta]|eukprot:KAG2434708.1 hypothetical protein HXX76_007598 [Chlamydomonas incerta]
MRCAATQAMARTSAQLHVASCSHWRARRACVTVSAAAPHTARVPALPRELHITLPQECRVPATTVPVLHQVLAHYAARTPRLGVVLDKVTRPGWPGVEALGHDHFAFRTFGVPGLGIASLERVLLPLGYSRVHDDPPLAFPAKKLAAAWFSATDPAARALLPRVFVSEIQVEKLSPRAQDIIRRAAGWAAAAPAEEVLVQVTSALLTGTAPWPAPRLADYELLMAESEYAAWVLAHGYSLNHTALALHRLPPAASAGAASASAASADIRHFNAQLQAAGLDLNPEGGLVKVSPDALLLQSAVVADRLPFDFGCGARRDIAAAYVEFVQRLRLPQYAGLPADQVREEHLREGFEVGNADRIFESTTLAAGAKT